jgi:hypothetical protein
MPPPCRIPRCPRGRQSPALLEVVTIIRDDGSESAIHAMAMRPKHQVCCLKAEMTKTYGRP